MSGVPYNQSSYLQLFIKILYKQTLQNISNSFKKTTIYFNITNNILLDLNVSLYKYLY